MHMLHAFYPSIMTSCTCFMLSMIYLSIMTQLQWRGPQVRSRAGGPLSLAALGLGGPPRCDALRGVGGRELRLPHLRDLVVAVLPDAQHLRRP